MSEQHPRTAEGETASGVENISASHELPLHASPEAASRHSMHEDLQTIQEQVKQTARSREELQIDANPRAEESHDHYVGQEVRVHALNRTMARVRKQLSAPNRLLSTFVHHPVTEAASSAGARTLARPSGLLSGSFFALTGSLVAVWAAKHYGFEYSYFTLVILFAGGYLLGLFIELSVFAIRLTQRRNK